MITNKIIVALLFLCASTQGVANQTITQTVNGVTLTARVIQPKEAQKMFTCLLDDVRPIAFELKNNNPHDYILPANGIQVKNLIDPKNLSASNTAAGIVAVLIPLVGWYVGAKLYASNKEIEENGFSVDANHILPAGACIKGIVFIQTRDQEPVIHMALTITLNGLTTQDVITFNTQVPNYV